MADSYKRLILDIREDLVLAYGEHLKPGYAVWDTWENSEPEEYTPYDITCQFINEVFTGMYSKEDLVQMSDWRHKQLDLCGAEVFQCSLAKQFSELFFDDRYKGMELHTVNIGDGYVDAVFRPFEPSWKRGLNDEEGECHH